MTKPIPDKAEIALEYPDKFYVGTFEGSSRFEAHLDPTGFTLVLERPGDDDVRKSIHMHINFGLFAGILSELAASVASIPQRRYVASRSIGPRRWPVAPGADTRPGQIGAMNGTPLGRPAIGEPGVTQRSQWPPNPPMAARAGLDRPLKRLIYREFQAHRTVSGAPNV